MQCSVERCDQDGVDDARRDADLVHANIVIIRMILAANKTQLNSTQGGVDDACRDADWVAEVQPGQPHWGKHTGDVNVNPGADFKQRLLLVQVL